MANTSRRLQDKENKMFIPRNVDGGVGDDHFLTGPKLFIFGISAIFAGYLMVSCYTKYNVIFATVVSLIVFYFFTLIVRYFVLSEKYYYSMYKRMKEIEVTTPAIFWGIVNKHEMDDGCVVTFNDLKMGVYVKLDRDSIVGREDTFREQHFDAISEFYAELNRNGLRYVRADIMEPAGKDNRIQELDDLVVRSSYNPNLYKLMNLQVAHIKNITRATLYESEYVLVYTEKLERPEYIMDIVVETAHSLLYGGYSGFTILDGTEIDELAKHIFGVRIFDSNEATIQVFKNNVNNTQAFTITKMTYKNGATKDLVVKPEPQENTTSKRSRLKKGLQKEEMKEVVENQCILEANVDTLSEPINESPMVTSTDILSQEETNLTLYDTDTLSINEDINTSTQNDIRGTTLEDVPDLDTLMTNNEDTYIANEDEIIEL